MNQLPADIIRAIGLYLDYRSYLNWKCCSRRLCAALRPIQRERCFVFSYKVIIGIIVQAFAYASYVVKLLI